MNLPAHWQAPGSRPRTHTSRRALRALIRAGATALVLLATLASAGCSKREETAGTSAPLGLTLDQATLVANVLALNLTDGGATFHLTTPASDGGGNISLTGVVDWVTHTGHAMVNGAGSEANVVEVYWDATSVFERRSDLDVLADSVGPDVQFVRRPANIEQRRLDQLLALVTGLSAKRSDNPLIVQQTAGSMLVRTDQLRGAAVTVLRYGEQSVFWLDGGGHMLRYEGNNTTGTAPVVVDVLTRGPQTIIGPPPAAVVDISAVLPLWNEIVGPA